ncbi:MAG TPA: hypothetical protein VF017_02410 [Thermoanaerobaculia bacterium]|nr:hypothetical protein [Thermoanaerobaculia bacterium]
MSQRLLLREEAQDEISAAVAWYDERSAGLGDAFLAEVRRGLQAIEDNPHRYPVIRGRTRRLVLRRFP